MLRLINRNLNGYVISPVIISCRRRGMFSLFETQREQTVSALVRNLQANEGHLRAVIKTLVSMGWLTQTGPDSFRYETDHSFAQHLLPETLELYDLDMPRYLSGQGGLLGSWIEKIGAGWNETNSVLADFLDGPVIVPILVAVSSGDWLLPDGLCRMSKGIQTELDALFRAKMWGRIERTGATLTETGRYLLDHAMVGGVAVSYRPMLRKIDTVIFGNPDIFAERNHSAAETHVNRSLNVEASGFQHQKYFAATDETIKEIFNSPISEQPSYVADMGCGDGSLLKRIYQVICAETKRGVTLDEHPLTMIAVDCSEEALESASETLTGIPHILLKGDICDPVQLKYDLAKRNVDPGKVFHIRSFLDHEIEFGEDSNTSSKGNRSASGKSSIHVTREGKFIPPESLHRGLASHFAQWAKILNDHGLLIIEVHTIPASTVLKYPDETESLYFDALQAFSGQHLVTADRFLLTAAEAGLLPKHKSSQRFPRNRPFTRITLQHLQHRPLKIRRPVEDDYEPLLNLERECWGEQNPELDRETSRRITDCSQDSLVMIADGKLVGAVYSQRIKSSQDLRHTTDTEVPTLHHPSGTVAQLLSLSILPSVRNKGFADELLNFMLSWLSIKPEIGEIVGVSRCSNYSLYSRDLNFPDYIRRRTRSGELIDPILRFHEAHGARIISCLPGFRPLDQGNQGYGVLLEYPLEHLEIQRAKASNEESKETRSPEAFLATIREAVRFVLGGDRIHLYSNNSAFDQMGLDSVDLLDLSSTLSRKFRIELETSFFLEHRTPTEVAAFFIANRE